MSACWPGELILQFLSPESAVYKTLVRQKLSTALHEAARWGHTAIVAALFRDAPCVDVRDTDGLTPLYFAAAAGQCGAAQLLLDSNADINCAATRSGWTALHSAADKNHTDVVRLLLGRGANTKLRSRAGQTARQLAEAKVNRQSLELFVSSDRAAARASRNSFFYITFFNVTHTSLPLCPAHYHYAPATIIGPRIMY